MAISSAEFQRSLGAKLTDALSGRYRFFKSRRELRADAPGGHDVLILTGATKYSPHITVDFYFGRNFSAAKQVEKRIGKHQFYYHIQQYSPNRKHMNGLRYSGPYTWSVDINDPPKTLVDELAEAVQGMALPFFERFADIRSARDAIANDDPWCFGGKTFWRQLLLLDMAMDDVAHFERWATNLDALSQQQANEMIAAFKATHDSVV